MYRYRDPADYCVPANPGYGLRGYLGDESTLVNIKVLEPIPGVDPLFPGFSTGSSSGVATGQPQDYGSVMISDAVAPGSAVTSGRYTYIGPTLQVQKPSATQQVSSVQTVVAAQTAKAQAAAAAAALAAKQKAAAAQAAALAKWRAQQLALTARARATQASKDTDEFGTLLPPPKDVLAKATLDAKARETMEQKQKLDDAKARYEAAVANLKAAQAQKASAKQYEQRAHVSGEEETAAAAREAAEQAEAAAKQRVSVASAALVQQNASYSKVNPLPKAEVVPAPVVLPRAEVVAIPDLMPQVGMIAALPKPVDAVKELVSPALDGVKKIGTDFASFWSGVKSSVSGAIDKVKEKAANVLGPSAAEKVGAAIEGYGQFIKHQNQAVSEVDKNLEFLNPPEWDPFAPADQELKKAVGYGNSVQAGLIGLGVASAMGKIPTKENTVEGYFNKEVQNTLESKYDLERLYYASGLPGWVSDIHTDKQRIQDAKDLGQVASKLLNDARTAARLAVAKLGQTQEGYSIGTLSVKSDLDKEQANLARLEKNYAVAAAVQNRGGWDPSEGEDLGFLQLGSQLYKQRKVVNELDWRYAAAVKQDQFAMAQKAEQKIQNLPPQIVAQGTEVVELPFAFSTPKNRPPEITVTGDTVYQLPVLQQVPLARRMVEEFTEEEREIIQPNAGLPIYGRVTNADVEQAFLDASKVSGTVEQFMSRQKAEVVPIPSFSAMSAENQAVAIAKRKIESRGEVFNPYDEAGVRQAFRAGGWAGVSEIGFGFRPQVRPVETPWYTKEPVVAPPVRKTDWLTKIFSRGEA